MRYLVVLVLASHIAHVYNKYKYESFSFWLFAFLWSVEFVFTLDIITSSVISEQTEKKAPKSREDAARRRGTRTFPYTSIDQHSH